MHHALFFIFTPHTFYRLTREEKSENDGLSSFNEMNENWIHFPFWSTSYESIPLLSTFSCHKSADFTICRSANLQGERVRVGYEMNVVSSTHVRIKYTQVELGRSRAIADLSIDYVTLFTHPIEPFPWNEPKLFQICQYFAQKNTHYHFLPFKQTDIRSSHPSFFKFYPYILKITVFVEPLPNDKVHFL